MKKTFESSFSSYLGDEVQQKIMWQLLVEPTFAEKVIPDIEVGYFDNPVFQNLFSIIRDYHKEYGKCANIQNNSVELAVNLYKNIFKPIDIEGVFSALENIKNYNLSVLNKDKNYDGDVVQRVCYDFIKQQKIRIFGENIMRRVKSGKTKDKELTEFFQEQIKDIENVGDTEDYGIEIRENPGKALNEESRQVIPTGIKELDDLMDGGLGRSEVGVILAPSGVGKTTILTKIANSALMVGKNVLQIVFEEDEDAVITKHLSLFTKIPLSEIKKKNKEDVLAKFRTEIQKTESLLVIKKFSQEDTTMNHIKRFMLRYEKRFGVKFDMVVLDYLDCLEPNKQTRDLLEAEGSIIKSFLALSSDNKIPCWTAIQGNRSSFDLSNEEFIEARHIGGSIKRFQKAHFFMSISKPNKYIPFANINIMKARFVRDGQKFRECIFNNDTLEITIRGQTSNDIIKRIPETETSDERLKRKEDELKNDEKNRITGMWSKVISKEVEEGDDQPKLNPNYGFDDEPFLTDDEIKSNFDYIAKKNL